jgi:hypothetical protein
MKFVNLPEIIKLNVMVHIEPLDLVQFEMTSKRMNMLCRFAPENIWAEKTAKDCPEFDLLRKYTDVHKDDNYTNWKSSIIRRHSISKLSPKQICNKLTQSIRIGDDEDLFIMIPAIYTTSFIKILINCVFKFNNLTALKYLHGNYKSRLDENAFSPYGMLSSYIQHANVPARADMAQWIHENMHDINNTGRDDLVSWLIPYIKCENVELNEWLITTFNITRVDIETYFYYPPVFDYTINLDEYIEPSLILWFRDRFG